MTTRSSAQAFVDRVLSAFPELRAEYDAIRRSTAAEGLAADLPTLFLEEHTWRLLGLTPPERAPDQARWRAWTSFLENEWGRDPQIDGLIRGAVLVHVPDRPHDPHEVRSVLGPRLAAVVDRERDVADDPAMRALAVRLAAHSPAVDDLAEENAFGDHGALLGVVFLADVARLVVERFSQGGTAAAEAREMLTEIEAAYGRDAVVDTAVATGFVEALPRGDEPGAAVAHEFGPLLRALYERDGDAPLPEY